jgi:glucose-6-phosphate dehydrogenase assembly protein OpcA
MTHLAWVPDEWHEVAMETLAGLGERHPSRGIVLSPAPDAPDGVDAKVSVLAFPLRAQRRHIACEVIELRLRGQRAHAPASIVMPLLVVDLPVFLRWRGRPPWGAPELDQLVSVADRLIVDSNEWPDLPGDYASFAELFPHVVASDIAWARTGRWRVLLASLWPAIGSVETIRVRGTAAQAHLVAGWLRSRLRRQIELEHEPAERLEGIDLDGEPAPFPPGNPPTSSDLLSDELERYVRDPVYEAAVVAAVAT